MDTLRQQIEAVRTSAGMEAAIKDSESLFQLFDIALCGHMTQKQQAAFLVDIKNRGLLK